MNPSWIDLRSCARLLAVATKDLFEHPHSLLIGPTHLCQHCEADINELATHGLSCVKSKGQHFSLMANNLIGSP